MLLCLPEQATNTPTDAGEKLNDTVSEVVK